MDSANRREHESSLVPLMRVLLLTKAEPRFADTRGVLLTKFRLKIAFPGRFELPTFRLGGGRSILLSYGNIFSFWLIYWVSSDPASRPAELKSANSCSHRRQVLDTTFRLSGFSSLMHLPRLCPESGEDLNSQHVSSRMPGRRICQPLGVLALNMFDAVL